MITRQELLNYLPPYRDEWVIIHDNQEVKDIISEILAAHKEFSQYYDLICPFFDAPTVAGVCKKLYKFCKDNIHYKVQKDALQRVRAFFRDAIFPLFKYTQQSSFSLTWKALSNHVVDECNDYEDEVLQNDGFSMVVVMLKVDYVVIKPDLAQFYYEQMEIK